MPVGFLVFTQHLSRHTSHVLQPYFKKFLIALLNRICRTVETSDVSGTCLTEIDYELESLVTAGSRDRTWVDRSAHGDERYF